MKRRFSRHLAAGTVLSSLLMVSTLHAQTSGSGDDLLKMEKNAANVVMPTNTYDNQRYSALSQINSQQRWQTSGGMDVFDRRAARS